MKVSLRWSLSLCFLGAVLGKDWACLGTRNQCSCATVAGIIDLSSIGNTNGTAAFKDIQGFDGYIYSYNPCYSFIELDCTYQSSCQVFPERSMSFPAGDASSASFRYDGFRNHVTYTSTDAFGTTMTTDVTLICDPGATVASLIVMGERGSSNYDFGLTTKCACPDGCTSSDMTTEMEHNATTRERTTLPPITTDQETSRSVPTTPPITTATETIQNITTQPVSIGRCSGSYGCSCQTENGDVIDLSSIGNKDGTARFRYIPSKDGFLYSFNPCYPFNQLDCVNAAVCIETLDQEISYVTGDYRTATFEFDGHINHLVYWAPGEHGIDRKTDVALLCDPEASVPKLEVIGEKQSQEYYLILTTKCACPGGCEDKSSDDVSPNQEKMASSTRYP